MKWKPWEREKALGKKAPHPVDERFGFADSLRYHIGLDTPFNGSYGTNFDRMRVGRIEDGKRYLGNGAWERVSVWEPEKRP